MSMHRPLYPQPSWELAHERQRLAPAQAQAFLAFSESVFAEGALPSKTKQLVAVAVAHVTQCPFCIRSHTRAALGAGVTPEEIMEAVWVTAEMCAGGVYAHSLLALDSIAEHRERDHEASARERP
jgi:AhpD family alkylhydroperoxidase